MIPAVDSKPKRMMTNYTTKAEYYSQKQNQITLIPTMEGKNTPPTKKPQKAPSKEGSQHKRTPTLQDSMSASAPVTALCFGDGNPLAFLFSARCIWMLYFDQWPQQMLRSSPNQTSGFRRGGAEGTFVP